MCYSTGQLICSLHRRDNNLTEEKRIIILMHLINIVFERCQRIKKQQNGPPLHVEFLHKKLQKTAPETSSKTSGKQIRMTTKNTAINTARRGADPIRFRGLTWAWSGVDSRPIRRWRGLFAALLFVLGAAVAAPEQAAAQTETTFISNSAQSSISNSPAIRGSAFTTGTGTYTLSSVGVQTGPGSSSTTPSVQIYGDTSGLPGTLVATMTNPGTIRQCAAG